MYSFEGCGFQLKEKKLLGPSKRWGHTAILQNDCMMFFGGNTENPPRSGTEPIFRLNLRSWEFERLEVEGGPAPRDSHSCVLLGSKMYVWGGCVGEQARNDLYCFDGAAWRKINQQGQIPAPRESQVAVGLDDRWIFLYGGCKDKQHFNDVFLFDAQSNCWIELKELQGRLPSRENAAACLIKGQIVVFGGLDLKGKHTNDMYRIGLKLPNRFSTSCDLQPRFDKVRYLNNPPSERAGHCTVAYRDRYIIVLGGETDLSIGTHKKSRVEILNEVWLFDMQTMIWQELRPYNHEVFSKRNNFAAVLHGDSIVLFGGLQSPGGQLMSDELIVFNLTPNRPQQTASKVITKMCNICSISAKCKDSGSHIPNPQSENVSVQPSSTHELDYFSAKELAMTIPDPLSAMQIIVDCLSQRGSSHIDISYNSQSLNPLLCFEATGKNFKDQTLKQWLSGLHIGESQVYRRLLFACLRLCQCIVLVHSDASFFRIAMICSTRSYYIEYERESKGVDMMDLINFKAVDAVLKQHGLWERLGSTDQQLFLIDLERHPLMPTKYELLSRGSDILISYRLQLPYSPLSGEQSQDLPRTLRERLKYYFFEPPQGLRVSINRTEVPLKSFKEFMGEIAYSGECFDIENKSGTVIRLVSQRKNLRIMYYHRNKCISAYSPNSKDSFGGYALFPDEVPSDYFGLGPDDEDLLIQTNSFLEGHISTLLVSQGALKRPPATSLEILAEQSKISTPVISSI